MDCDKYKVGQFTLQPHRQLLKDGNPISAGRRAIELLSVLAKAKGALVTKDELMSSVWPNTVVEENALQVHIAALRKLLGSDANLLSTIHGFGYRLSATPLTASADVEAPPQTPTQIASSRKPWVLVGLAALPAICLVAGGLWFLQGSLPRPARPSETRVVVLPFDIQGHQDVARAFSEDLSDAIVSELSANQIQAVSRTESRALRGPTAGTAIDTLGADLLLNGAVKSDGKTIDVHLYLDDAREHVSIWAGDFQGTAEARQALQARVAAQTTEMLHWAKAGRSGKNWLDATALAAFVAGRESLTGVRNGSIGASYAAYKRVTAAAPDFSWGHSAVAMTDAFMLTYRTESVSSTPDEIRAEEQLEARKALALEPHNGEAYLAIELSSRPLEWKAHEALLLKGSAMDPNFEPVIMMEGRLLWAVGRGREALPWLVRAHDLSPIFNGENFSLAISLMTNGRAEQSRTLVAQMRELWPNQMSTNDALFWTRVLSGATGEVLTQLADPALRPYSMNQQSADTWIMALKASSSDDPAAKIAAISRVKETVDGGSLSRGHALTLLTMLGDVDGAFAQAEHFQPINTYSPPFLFLALTAPMRSDARFMPLARKLGFVSYWRETGHWPDFCSEPDVPYDCRVEAAKGV